MFKRPKIGLALGGGGARGIAHIGILKVLEQEKIPIDCIAGTSAGSIVGAMYALHTNAELIETRLRNFLDSSTYKKMKIENVINRNGDDADSFFSQVVTYLKERIVINLAYSRTSIISNKHFTTSLKSLIDEVDIEKTKIPYCAVASDIVTGKEVYLKSGNIITAVTASSSIPGFLPPLPYGDSFLLDGCVNENVPVKAALALGADIVIAVNVSKNLDKRSEYDNIIDIITRTNHITSTALTNLQLEQADLVLRPSVGQFHWSEFSHLNTLIAKGESEAKRLMPLIKKAVSRRYYIGKKLHLAKRLS